MLLSMKSVRPPRLFLEQIGEPLATFELKHAVCHLEVNFQFTKDCQCISAAFVQHNSPIFVSDSVYCNFMYKQIVNSTKFNWLINIA